MVDGTIVAIGILVLFILGFSGLFIWYGILNVMAKYYRGEPITTTEKVLTSILGVILVGSILILLVMVALMYLKNKRVEKMWKSPDDRVPAVSFDDVIDFSL